MKNLHNIEKSAFIPGEYIGYGHSDGDLWRIRRGSSGWYAVKRCGHTNHHAYTIVPTLRGPTLAYLSIALDNA
jgi:hypothetical protein